MSDIGDRPVRGPSETVVWDAACKDCRAELDKSGRRTGPRSGGRQTDTRRRARQAGNAASDTGEFTYSSNWAVRIRERGGTRSDRCPRHRQEHRRAIEAIAVAYIDIKAIGEVGDRDNPTGPLGGLGPLPVSHRERTASVDLADFKFGLSDRDILDLLEGLCAKRVAVLEAGTGTGKSTFGPFRLANPPLGAPLRLADLGPIVVTEPRVPAATEVAHFVGEALCFGHDPKSCRDHYGPGFPVGSQAEGKKFWDDACHLIYVTDGTMINWIRDGRLARIGTVIVDEAHERSENIDLILALLRDQLPRHPHLRVIIASATINKDFFIEFFGGSDEVHHQSVPPAKTFGYGVPLFPLEEITNAVIEGGTDDGAGGILEGWARFGPDDARDPSEDLWATTRQLLDLRAEREIPVDEWPDRMPSALTDQILRIARGTAYGDILAFLPTQRTIEAVAGAVRDGLDELGINADVLGLYRAADDETKRDALAPRGPGRPRKIVLATNLAETSLTVEGARFVVDSGLICQSEWNPTLARGDYPTKPHSRSGVRQRWGRVGRDAPGWVFPLYSKAQFAQLPRDTPAESTRANLEESVIKLKAAGVDDVESIAFPATFEHPAVTLDQDGERARLVASRELQRAQRALKANGAVDRDGHLTDLGRELSRFPGSSESAMALMFADRMACVPEVAIGLSILESGLLVGPKALFRYDGGWPPAWRVHARRCHRGLAVECQDDLELVLRVFSAWERSPDPDRWAAQWWVNPDALEGARTRAAKNMEALSPRMNKAHRALDLRLLPRARAAITRAVTSLHYLRRDSDAWASLLNPDSPPAVVGPKQLTPPADHVVAFGRYQPPSRDEADTPSPILQNLVTAVPWACDGEPDPFDLAILAARQLREPSGVLPPSSHSLRQVRIDHPVGSIVTARIADGGDDGQAIRVRVRAEGFAYPGDLPDLEAADEGRDSAEDEDATRDSTAGSDGLSAPTGGDDEVAGSWGEETDHIAETPEEEIARQVLDAADLEVFEDDQDVAFEEAAEVLDSEDIVAEEAELIARAEDPATQLPCDEEFAAVITGYTATDSKVGLVLRAIPGEQRSADPADHADLQFGEELEVEVGGWVDDYGARFRVLTRCDGKGEFLLHEQARGLDGRAGGLGEYLLHGSRWNAIAVPGYGRKDPITVTLLPALKRHLAKLSGRSARGQPRDRILWTSATVVEQRERGGEIRQVVVEVDGGTDAPVVHRLVVDADQLSSAELPTELGTRVEVGVGASRRARWGRLPRQVDGFDQLLDRFSDHLREDDRDPRKVVATFSDLPIGVAQALVNLQPGSNWERKVWRFWDAANQRRVVRVRPPRQDEVVAIPDHLKNVLHLSGERQRLSDEYGVRVQTSGNQVSVSGVEAQVRAALDDLATIVRRPAVQIEIAAPMIGRVIGKSGAQIKEMQSEPGITCCELEEGCLLIVATDEDALDRLIERVRVLATAAEGTLVVPDPDANRRLIGKGGSIVNLLREQSGCTRANAPERGKRAWTLEAPKRENLERFADLARQYVPGVDLTITQEHSIQVKRIKPQRR